MDIRLIAFDLDGTLLRSDKTISPRTMQALHAAAEKGVLLVPATGRLYLTLPDALKNSALTRYMILVNGAQVYDSAAQKTLAREDLTPEAAQQVLAHLRAQNVIRGIYVDGCGWMSRTDFAEVDNVMKNSATVSVVKRTYHIVDDLDTFAAQTASVQKIIAFFREQADKQPTISDMTARFPECAVSSSVVNNIEINAKHATKGHALRLLCQSLGLSTAQCMAFGDDTNDCTMLREAGLGVAMGNAADAIQACANAVTETNDNDGVARMIERVLEL